MEEKNNSPEIEENKDQLNRDDISDESADVGNSEKAEMTDLPEEDGSEEQNMNQDEQVSDSEDETESTETVENETEPEDSREKTRKSIFDIAEITVTSIVMVFIIVSFVFRLASVNGSSMYPTLKDKEILVLSNLFYEPKTGDIIVFQQSDVENRLFDYPLVKRVIATEGQTIEIDFTNWIVKVDGVALDEDYVNYIKGASMKRLDLRDGKIVVPQGCLFVMGDNRNNSTDSRDSRVSFIRKDEVMGRALFRVFPLTKIGVLGK